MPKSSQKQIDQDEKRIIQELQKNSKESIDKIAQNCGFSRQKVWRIIKRLEKNQTIWGYHPIVDDEKLNQKRFLILIRRTSKPAPKDMIKLVLDRELKNQAKDIGVSVESSFFVHGKYDWVLNVTAKSIINVKKFIELFSYMFKEGYVSDMQILEVMFPVEVNGFSNPNLKDLESFFD